jgi:glycyl-tRNA synthetase beta chain
MKDLIIEIGTEELPALSQKILLDFCKDAFQAVLQEHCFSYKTLTVFVTPTRLALQVQALAESSPAQTLQKKGPSLSAPAPAIKGFAQRCMVAPEALIAGEDGYYYCLQEQKGLDLFSFLDQQLPLILDRIPFSKTMRWGCEPRAFLRPVHWILALYGKTVVPLTLWGLQSDCYTQGQRYLCPQALPLKDASDYQSLLEKGHVMLNPQQRSDRIQKEIHRLAAKEKASAVLPPMLLEELAGLVEWPYILALPFNPSFLSLPKDILITVMQNHQRYVALEDPKKDHALLPLCYVVVQQEFDNSDKSTIIHDHRRVLHARFEDALFFYQQDIAHPLSHYTPLLKQLLFHQKLGSIFDKVQLLTALTPFIGAFYHCKAADCEKLSLVSKSDLITKTVQEFPELQGVMGRLYAQHHHEPVAISEALFEQYLPRNASDILPQTPLGVTLALSDRLLHLVGIFGHNIRPTGSKDPFGLRRNMLALLRIVLAHPLPLSFKALFAHTLTLYPPMPDPTKTLNDLLAFAAERFLQELLTQAYSKTVIQAVFTVHFATDSPTILLEKVKALSLFAKEKQALTLAQAHKRVRSLLKNASFEDDSSLPPLQLKDVSDTVEHTLFQALKKAQEHNASFIKAQNYGAYCHSLIPLIDPLNIFFDTILVLDKKPDIRLKRLRLLSLFDKEFNTIGDLSCLCSLS